MKLNKEQYFEFLETHSGEIKGLYNDSYWRDGGWNGLMGAISEVERRYNVSIDFEWEDDEFEKFINENI